MGTSEIEVQLLIASTDETTLIPNRFHINVDRTMKLLQDQEATNGKFQITIEDMGPKVSRIGIPGAVEES